MGAEKISQVNTAGELTSADRLTGIRYDGSAYSNLNFTADQIADYVGDGPNVEQVHTSGATVTIGAGKRWLIVNPASVLAALTITLPASPKENEIVYISFGGSIAGAAPVITTLTIAPNSGQAILQQIAPTTSVSGDAIAYRYNSTKWYRISSDGSAESSTIVQQTLTDGATVTWDLEDGRDAILNIAGNRTLAIVNLPDNPPAFGIIEVEQDATGSRTLALPASSIPTTLALSTTPGDVDQLGFRYNGTNFFWVKESYSPYVLLEDKVFTSAGSWTLATDSGTASIAMDSGVNKLYLKRIGGSYSVGFKSAIWTVGNKLRVTVTGVNIVGGIVNFTLGALPNLSKHPLSNGTNVFLIDTTGLTNNDSVFDVNASSEAFIGEVKIEKHL